MREQRLLSNSLIIPSISRLIHFVTNSNVTLYTVIVVLAVSSESVNFIGQSILEHQYVAGRLSSGESSYNERTLGGECSHCSRSHSVVILRSLQKHSRSCGKDDSSAANKLRKQIKNIGRSRHDSSSFNSNSSREQTPMRATSVPAQLNFVGRADVPRRTAEEWHGTTTGV